MAEHGTLAVVRPKVLLHAVVRFDRYLLNATSDPAHLVTVVAVLPTREEADGEVARLNGLREADDGVFYFWTPARYYPDGRAAGG